MKEPKDYIGKWFVEGNMIFNVTGIVENDPKHYTACKIILRPSVWLEERGLVTRNDIEKGKEITAEVGDYLNQAVEVMREDFRVEFEKMTKAMLGEVGE